MDFSQVEILIVPHVNDRELSLIDYKYIKYFCSKLGKDRLLSVLQLSSTAEQHKD